MSRQLLWITLALVGAAGCGGSSTEQSFQQGLAVICESPAHIEEGLADAADKATAASLWLSAELTNEEARKLFASLAPLSPQRKATAVRAAALRSGIDQCPLADLWSSTM
jgi:hypothetical protein